jgi:REP element-mobilizing transposase RayT
VIGGDFAMPTSPLAYLITFSTYGAWLHGRDLGSVDKHHNEVGMPFLASDAEKEGEERANMREPPYLLDATRRQVALRTILEVAAHRCWRIWACHVRTTHVHVIVSGNAKPEKIMSDFKAYASRRLKEQLQEPPDRKRWTQHGNTRYLWTEEQVADKIDYVLNRQGAPLAAYDGPNPSEPEA